MGELVMMSWHGKHRLKRGPLAHDDISTMRAPTHGVRARQVEVSHLQLTIQLQVPSYPLLSVNHCMSPVTRGHSPALYLITQIRICFLKQVC